MVYKFMTQNPPDVQDKIQSKGTALLLLFFISKSQGSLQHGTKARTPLQVQDGP